MSSRDRRVDACVGDAFVQRAVVGVIALGVVHALEADVVGLVTVRLIDARIGLIGADAGLARLIAVTEESVGTECVVRFIGVQQVLSMHSSTVQSFVSSQSWSFVH